MKRTLLSLATILVLLLLASSAHASPLIYTFGGTVRNNPCLTDYCGGGVPPGSGLAPGSAVTFTVLVDFDVVFLDLDDTLGWDTFLATYLSGPSLWWNYGGLGVGGGGVNYTRDGRGYLLGAPPMYQWDYGFWLYGPTRSVRDWVVGTPIVGFDQFFIAARAYYDLQLESISAAPVPEPASLLLLGTGLVGLRAWRKRR